MRSVSLVWFRLLSGHHLGKICSLGWLLVHVVILLIVILVISHFGFEDWIWVLIASAPDHCLLVTCSLFFTFVPHLEPEYPLVKKCITYIYTKCQNGMLGQGGERIQK